MDDSTHPSQALSSSRRSFGLGQSGFSAASAAIEEELGRAREAGQAAEDEDGGEAAAAMEAVDLAESFFDRSCPVAALMSQSMRSMRQSALMSRSSAVGEPVHDAQAQATAAGLTRAPSGDDDSSGAAVVAGWRTAEGFLSKRVLHLDALPGSGAGASAAADGGAELQPPLTLPPPDHPVLDSLRLVGGGQSALPRAVGHQVFLESTGAEGSLSLRAECQPIVISLCAESLHTLFGCAWLGEVCSTAGRRPPQARIKRPAAARLPPAGSLNAVPELAVSFAAVVPVVRLDLALAGPDQDAPAGPRSACRVVADVTLPRFLALRTDAFRSAPPGSYEEVAQADFADVNVYLAQGRRPAARLLSLDPGAGVDAAASVCVLSRAPAPAVEPPRPGSLDEPPAAVPEALGELAAAEGEGASVAGTPLASEWTKISEAPLDRGAEGRPSRGSAVLQDLRHASQRLLRGPAPGRGRRRSVPPPRRPGDASRKPCAQRSSSADSRPGLGRDGESVARESRLEVQISLPSVRLLADVSEVLRLREALQSFSERLGEPGGGGAPAGACEAGDDGDLETADVPPIAFTLSLASVGVRLVRERCGREEAGACRADLLRFEVAPVQCRMVRLSRTSLRVCALGQDVRLDVKWPGQEGPGQLVRPWFRPAFHPRPAGQSAAGAGARGFEAPPGYPWAARCAWRKAAVVAPVFQGLGDERWREAQTLMLQAEVDRLGDLDHTSLVLKVSRLAAHVHPLLYQDPAGLLRLVGLDEVAQAPPRPAAAALVSYELSLLDCLADVPSETYGLALASGQDAAGSGDNWRAVIHVDGLDVSTSACSAQGLKVSAKECSVYVVDHPCHLSQHELVFRDAGEGGGDERRGCTQSGSHDSGSLHFYMGRVAYAFIASAAVTAFSGAGGRGAQILYCERGVFMRCGPAVRSGCVEFSRWRRRQPSLCAPPSPSPLPDPPQVSASPKPAAFLPAMGFAHAVELRSAAAIWSGSAPAGDAAPAARPGEASPDRSRASLEVSVGSLAGHACADTVRCLLCAGVELAEALLPSPAAAPGPAASVDGRPPAPPADAAPELVPGPEREAGVSILRNIDLFAFDGPAAEATPGAGRAEPARLAGSAYQPPPPEGALFDPQPSPPLSASPSGSGLQAAPFSCRQRVTQLLVVL